MTPIIRQSFSDLLHHLEVGRFRQYPVEYFGIVWQACEYLSKSDRENRFESAETIVNGSVITRQCLLPAFIDTFSNGLNGVIIRFIIMSSDFKPSLRIMTLTM
ncbi:MAG: hypothetical protein ACO3EZ_11960 [Prochlorotrichaceae cyanobacterium]